MLKAVIRVCVTNPRYDEEWAKFAKSVRKVQKCVIRLYVIKAQNLMPSDFSGFADPYLTVTLGDKDVKDKKHKDKQTLNPDFFTFYEFPTTLPGPALLKLQVYDSNMINR